MKNFKTVMELIGLSILINENTEYCSFVDFSGHVEKVAVRIYKSKELCIERCDQLYKVDLYLGKNDWTSEEKVTLELEDTKKALHGYLYGNSLEIPLEPQQESTRP